MKETVEQSNEKLEVTVAVLVEVLVGLHVECVADLLVEGVAVLDPSASAG